MVGDHLEGMGFLRDTAIDHHLLRRNRHFDMLEVIKKYPELLGIGLDEDTAIVVRGDSFEVIGRNYVVIYDNKSVIPPNGKFYFLAPGDRYNLKTRQATRPAQTMRPIDRVKKKEDLKKKDKAFIPFK
jgi:cyanophycinase